MIMIDGEIELWRCPTDSTSLSIFFNELGVNVPVPEISFVSISLSIPSSFFFGLIRIPSLPGTDLVKVAVFGTASLRNELDITSRF